MQTIQALAAIAEVFKEDGTPLPSWLVLLHPLEFPAYLFVAFFFGHLMGRIQSGAMDKRTARARILAMSVLTAIACAVFFGKML